MAGIANGIRAFTGFIPVIGTFSTFSTYMLASIRLSALSHFQIIYIFTHDSIFLGIFSKFNLIR
jgi:transketolase